MLGRSNKFIIAATSVKESIASNIKEKKRSVTIRDNSDQAVTARPVINTISYDQLEYILSKPPEERLEAEVKPFVSWIKSKCKVLDKCAPAVVQDILQHCSVETYTQDTLLIKCGDRGDCFYVIIDGTASVWVGGHDNPEYHTDKETGLKFVEDRSSHGKAIANLDAGQGFGEVALINNDCTRTASIICESKIKLLCIKRDLYDRSIKEWQAREFHEKYSFIFNSAYLMMLPAKNRYLVACALTKETFNFGNKIVKQGEPANDLYFILSGQVRVSCNMHKLEHTIDAHKQSKMTYQELQKMSPSRPKRNIKSAGRTRENAIPYSQDICLLSAYDVIGSVECALDIPTYCNTVTGEGNVSCFRLSKSAYNSLVKDRSSRTTAGLCKLAMLQNEARIARLKEKDHFLVKLLTLLQEEYIKLCRHDTTLMKSIEEHIKSKTSQTLGYGSTCYAKDPGPINKKRNSKTLNQHKPPLNELKLKCDDMTNDGMQFLATISCKGVLPPSLSAMVNSTASRYSVPGNIIKSPRRNSVDYIKSLSTQNSTKNDQVAAWTRSADFAT